MKADLNRMIGQKLKEVRTGRNLSLDKLAQLTSVSKPMLGQIERGESNPTVSTLWKIASGLGVSFTTFIEEEEPAIKLVTKQEVEPIPEESGLFQVRPLYPMERGKSFEVFSVALMPGCHYKSEPHSKGIEELILVQEGSMWLVLGELEYELQKDQSLRFSADYPHEYHNDKGYLCEMTMIIYYSHTH
jgi:transcriptional regulator with XRE-family HTH domain